MKKHDNRFPVTLDGLSVSIYKDDDRSFNRALRTFNKKVQEDGLLKECRDRMYFEKDSEKRVRAKKAARKRWLKKQELSEKNRY